ncbi:hypothetical protein SLEP1_g35197 [Rubroshorea leprosula]|uniref:Cotton fiber protein n=1 Tax=Rubroshorea leprosula TaxID=152421 RepID=A0AAV5KMH3_9ROSI|nr:hypothetical protein SLEP1_g35197 [Rubroshorea leprosula]
MVGPSRLKTLHPLQPFSLKTPSATSSSTSTLSSMKIKTLIHTLFYTHISRILRALSKAKSKIIQTFKENQAIHFILYPTKKLKKHRHKKTFFGSFRLHYNWCSSHVLPVPAPVLNRLPDSHLYNDSTWNSMISTEPKEEASDSQLSGYLQWLEEKPSEETEVNEIDKLADMFIASCHEKFLLEKVESYRRFQEMLARSV